MKLILKLIMVSIGFVPKTVFAIAATSSEVFCAYSYVAVGTVLRAKPIDCRIEEKLTGNITPWCLVRNKVSLEIEVSEILGVKDEAATVGITVGNKIQLEANFYSGYTSIVGDRHVTGPTTNEPPANDAVSEIFGGKKFIFSIGIHRYDYIENGVLIRDHISTQPYQTVVWFLEEKDWIIDILKNGDEKSCPKPYPI